MSDSPQPVHKRRTRYRGTHPRRFAEKYKEHNLDRYPAEARKVIEAGKTPAGTHRPISVSEILAILNPKPGEKGVDATMGYGGHARELLPRLLPGGRLYGLDVDPLELPRTELRLRKAGFSEEIFVARRTNFAGLPQVLADEGLTGVDFVLADLGLSSMQIDNPERGFSFKHDGPLDLRMNPQRGRSASAMLAAMSESELSHILQENSDEPNAALIAKTICASRSRRPINTTRDLAAAVMNAFPQSRRFGDDVEVAVRQTFQALRIAVNDEFGALETFLRNLTGCLLPGGRVAILTFHSGEDRRVKKAFLAGERDGTFSGIAREVIRPTAQEIHSNPRASSAKLRWAIRA